MTTTEYVENDNTISQEETVSIVNKIEQEKQASKIKVEKAVALKRLFNNPDFQFIIKQEYFTQEPKSIANTVANTTTEANLNMQLRNLHAVGALRNFFTRILSEGEAAESYINMSEQEIINIYKQQSATTDLHLG